MSENIRPFQDVAGNVDKNHLEITKIDKLLKSKGFTNIQSKKVTDSIIAEASDINSHKSDYKDHKDFIVFMEGKNSQVEKLFDTFSKLEKISSSEMIEEISKIASPKAKAIITQHENKKVPPKNTPQARQEEKGHGAFEAFKDYITPDAFKKLQAKNTATENFYITMNTDGEQ